MASEQPQDYQYASESLDQFATYEDYLDSQLSETDLFYLEDEELARQLVELGYRGSGETLRRDDFEARKRAERERNAQKTSAPKPLASAGKDLSQYPFLAALASREDLVRNGKLTVSTASWQEARLIIVLTMSCNMAVSASSSFATRTPRVKKSADTSTTRCV
jgi:hypothetical protein